MNQFMLDHPLLDMFFTLTVFLNCVFPIVPVMLLGPLIDWLDERAQRKKRSERR